MANTLPNIIYEETEGSSIVDSPDSPYFLEFEKHDEFFSSLESKVRFIRDCEKLVRQNDRYSKYIHQFTFTK